MNTYKHLALAGESEGYGGAQCVGKDCAVSTFPEIFLAIGALVVLCLIIWIFESWSGWERKWAEWVKARRTNK